VTAYEWHKLPQKLNVSDFDTLILDFSRFQDREYARSIDIKLLPSWRQFARHVFSTDSEVIAIGSPRFSLGTNPFVESTWWLPLELECVYETGEDIREINPEFSFYFAHVRRWFFHLDRIAHKAGDICHEYLAVGAQFADNMRIPLKHLAETRFHRAIGFKINLNAYIGTTDPVKFSGDVYWLPEPTEISISKAIDLILSERYHLQFEKAAPEWLSQFRLPSTEPIIDQIKEDQAAIDRLTKQLEMRNAQLARASRFLKVLYEQGEDVLEPVVRDALRELGAQVEDPKQRGREDGRLTDPDGRLGMLEIKGRSGNLRLTDVRELDNWVRDAMANDNYQSKGLLIANLQCDRDPKRRTNFIPSNCADAAKLFDIAILTTTQLFAAIVSDQKGELDRNAFWAIVFSTKGLCELPISFMM
jgi:hypothetical protein